ncbi:MAG: DoxX family membrane protein [Bdellovibrionales bacterium]|nr:DoxX family membrane protein [Bdellovibrionales bacterium]
MSLSRIIFSGLILAFCLFLIGAVSAVATRNDSRLKLAIRYFLGAIFILYGLQNFFRLHPFDVPITGDIHSVKSADLFWYFFGYSQGYVVYLGAIEVISGILIIIPRTFRLGALAIAVTATNIAILDFVYSVGPVQYWVSFLALLSFSLIIMDRLPYQTALQTLMTSISKDSSS